MASEADLTTGRKVFFNYANEKFGEKNICYLDTALISNYPIRITGLISKQIHIHSHSYTKISLPLVWTDNFNL